MTTVFSSTTNVDQCNGSKTTSDGQVVSIAQRIGCGKGAQSNLSLVQGFLSDGLSYEPHRHVGWYNLGLLYKAQQRPDEAERCLRTAVGLSLTAPVMSFSKLPRLL